MLLLLQIRRVRTPFCEVLTYAFRTLSVRQQQAYTSSSLLIAVRIFRLGDGQLFVRLSVCHPSLHSDGDGGDCELSDIGRIVHQADVVGPSRSTLL